jgi:dTDP-glucose pyrophosphorylase/CBS domain-containing protein
VNVWFDRARWSRTVVSPETSIADAIAALDRAGFGVLHVCDASGKLVGVVTDGDIRRGILRHVAMTRPTSDIMNAAPLTGRAPMTLAEAQRFLDHGHSFKIDHLPLVDAERKLVGLILRTDFGPREELPVHAVVMAGGFGQRLRPLTEDVPKPMLPVGDQPLMETLVSQLRQSGVSDVSVTTHYKGEKIKEHFGDGSSFGVNISYVAEEVPLGTAGALRLTKRPEQPMLVINADILTSVDFKALFAFHRTQRAVMTVAVTSYEYQVPYGVVETSGGFVRRLEEKPTYRFFTNAGIYVVEPRAYDLIPDGERFDMTDLIQRLIEEELPVASFPIHEYWLDIGSPADYERAQEAVKSWPRLPSNGKPA